MDSTEEKALALAIAVYVGIPVLLWSLPGQGKSSFIHSISRSYKFRDETIVGSAYDPSDFTGIPFLGDKNSMHYSTPPWAKRIINSDVPTILFFDEISNSPGAVQAATLRVILEKVVGDDVALPPQTRIVAAANPTSVNASGAFMTAPNKNRFLHLDWSLSPEYFNRGMSTGFPAVQFPKFPRKDVFEQKKRLMKSLVGAFILRNPGELASTESDIIASDDSDEFKATDMAFPSPRTWENAAILYAAATFGRVDNQPIPPSVAHMLVAGSVGTAAAIKFISFVNNLDIPEPGPILDGTSKWTSKGKRPDVVYAALASMQATLSSRLAANPGDKNSWTNFGNELALIASEGNEDIAFPYASRWLRERPEGAIPSKDHLAAFSGLVS